MRVALDTNAVYMTRAGVARYVRGLQQGFRQLAAPGLELIELAWRVENFEYRQPQRAMRTFFRELIWAPFIAPAILAKQQADLLHSTLGVFVIPPKGIKHVATLHDLAVLREPKRFRAWQRRATLKRLRRLSLADRIICDSQFTAAEARELLGSSQNRLEVVYCGCDFARDGPPAIEAAPVTATPADFFLFVGSLEPGKNLALLKEVYALAAKQAVKLPPLVIVGARWEGVPNEGAPPFDWLYLGRQSDNVLVYLYRRALALLFPSKYEGFGFPVVEAMALGCPVICSRVASLPEVGGDAALYAELDPAAYLQAIQRLLREHSLRQELIERGHEQAQNFSWKKCAEETLAVYRDVSK